MRVLVVNAGSSSVKLSVLDGNRTEHTGSADPHDTERALADLLSGPDAPDAVGHRVVHGGPDFTGPVVVDDEVLDRIDALRALAPLHQGPAVTALRQARAALPGTPQVACFDTAFHATLPAAAHTYAVPRRWRAELGVRRYGFHGLAHEWAARRAAGLLGRPLGELRIVTAHLGSGASLCAVDRGRSVDTTMGFTPTAGLVMGSRSGDLDPAVPLWLVEQGMDRAGTATAWIGAAGCSHSPGTPTRERWWTLRPAKTPSQASRWRSGRTGPGRTSRRWAGSTSSCSAVVWASTARSCGGGRSSGWRSSASRSVPAATRPPTAVMPTSPVGAPSRSWSSPRART